MKHDSGKREQGLGEIFKMIFRDSVPCSSQVSGDQNPGQRPIFRANQAASHST